MKIRLSLRAALHSICLALLLAFTSFQSTQAQGVVSDALEYAALKDLYESTEGSNWNTTTNWPTSWPATATSTEFGTWAGVTVSNGDVTSLNLGFNNLTGTIPASLGNLTELVYVGLNSNSLSGELPAASFSNAHNLQYIYLDHNQLSGPLPAWTGTNFPYMQYFNLSYNQFSGAVPTSYTTFTGLDLLDLAYNQLTSFPPVFASMTWLKDLRLSGNPFPPGPMPTWIGQMSGLIVLLMGGNNFTGTIPASLGDLHHLEYLSLNANQFTGSIPASLVNCTSMTTLDLLSNQLDDLSNDLSGMTHLGYLGLSNNRFHGALPEWLGNLSSLSQLHLNGNQFTSFPSSFGNLTNLVYLYVQDNQLTGSLPDVSRMTNFAVLNAARNHLSGSIPSSFSNCNMYLFDVSDNQLSGEFPSITNWTNLAYLTLNRNRFSGSFPSPSGLNGFIICNAESNHFTSFPVSLLGLPAISYINFQSNDLTAIDNLEIEAAAGHVSRPIGLAGLYIGYNQLDFKTIGALYIAGMPLLSTFPQNEISDIATVGYSVSSLLSIPSRPVQTTTTITWEKNVGGTWTDVTANSEDATHRTFQLSHATQQDIGTYRWKTTDSQFPDAVINSTEIEVKTNTQITLDNYAFQYKYDGRRRMTQKKVPGADWVYMVYDNRDRLVLTQDGNQRLKNQWSFTKYDALNRPVMTGIYTDATTVDQATMQGVVNNYYTNLTQDHAWFETFTISPDQVHGYDNKSFPQISDPTSCLTITYYDTYEFGNNWGTVYNPVNNDIAAATANGVSYEQAAQSNQVIGQMTGTKIRTIDTSNKSNFKYLKTITYYDEKYRPVQVISDNDMGGTDRTTMIYDFVGKVLKTKITHQTDEIKWKDVTGAFVTSNSVASLNGAQAANPKSELVLAANTDGWIEFKAEYLGVPLAVVGLLPEDGSEAFNFTVMQQGVNVKENGVSVAAYYPRKSQYVLRIARVGSTITFTINNDWSYTSPRSSTSALRLNVYVDNFSGIQDIRTSFASVSSTHSTERTFAYDHAGRLLTMHHSIDGAAPILLVKNEYNELGQLVDKNLHSTDGTTFKQSVDYRYNIRGWLTSINNADLTPGSNNEDDSNYGKDLFGMELAYEKPVTGLTTTTDVQFNGNISAITYSHNQALGAIKSNGYKYGYDPMNRLKEAQFRQKNTTWGLTSYNSGNQVLTAQAYSETGFDYDLNGNIKQLHRSGSAGSQTMDALTYAYEGNQLLSVTDGGDVSKGFVDGNVSGDDYQYDVNGNMIADANKGIAAITYNHLNLPEKVTKTSGDYIKYSYDATGRKLSQQVFDPSNTLKKKSDYAGEYFYENDTLKFINHEEGRVVVLDLNRDENKDLLYRNDGSTLSGIVSSAGMGATMELETISGESYIKVTNTCSPECNGAGVALATINTQAGETYTVRIKGYSSGPVAAQVMLRGNQNSSYLSIDNYLPIGSSSEGWKEVTYTIQPGTNDLTVYLLWWMPAPGQTLHINDIEFVKLKDANSLEYQYHLKDHLGNVRTTFTTKDEEDESQATYETANAGVEQSKFLHHDQVRYLNHPFYDHTKAKGGPSPEGDFSQRLSGSAQEKIGLARSLSVMPGDKVDMEVYAKYYEPISDDQSAFATLMNNIINGLAVPAGTIIDGAGYALSANNTLPFTNGLTKDGGDPNAPKAYLNWAVFSRDYIQNIAKSGFKRVTTNSREDGTDVNHDWLKPDSEIVIDEPGFIYIWLSNENETPVEVYFDDFKVMHTKSPVIQQEEYYPFGLAFNSYQRENGMINSFLYNGKEKQDELGLDWMDYGARMYMPEIGRWGVIDPLAETSRRWSPYNYAYDNPIRFIDPDGMKADDFGNETYNGMVDIGDNAISTSDETDPKEKKQDDKKSSEKTGRTYEGIDIDKLSFGEQVALAFVAGWNEFGKAINIINGEDTGVENNLNTTNETIQLAGLLIAGHLEMTSTNGGASVNKVLDKADEVASVTARVLPNGSQYSVAYEMTLASSSYPGIYRGAHFLEANKALDAAMASDVGFASSMLSLNVSIPRSSTGAILGKSPTNWVWHHHVNAGVMQLVPKNQHTIGNTFWNTLHPNGVGGFAIWGK